MYELERSVAQKTCVMQPLPEDRFLNGFQHIFAGGCVHHALIEPSLVIYVIYFYALAFHPLSDLEHIFAGGSVQHSSYHASDRGVLHSPTSVHSCLPHCARAQRIGRWLPFP